jgi:hypothetical protein
MYYICKSFQQWTFYDSDKGNDRAMNDSEVTKLKALFSTIIENRNILALEISLLSPNKLIKFSPTGKGIGLTYVICKFQDIWKLLDGGKGIGRQMDADEIAFTKSLFPAMAEESNFSGISVKSVNPRKVDSLPDRSQGSVSAKPDALAISANLPNKLQHVTGTPNVEKASDKGRTAPIPEASNI